MEDAMPMFICSLSWTDQGLRSVKDAPKRAQAARELAKKVGVEIKEVYLTSGDDDLLAHCLFEALRFNPINFGPFRLCAKDYIVAAGTGRSKRLKAGTKVLASTMSAMFVAA